ncbi:4-carboxymuconolactone decarboxylase [Aestuariicella hydrocarbonica]|uniref:4-carboxymuconolactone decarboxylase n=1 Tax=Pseudomaricurvus hydrocarbonicus TaxID=1470433 RepID=A0A9E5MH22_9GAMM|nr:carboxymuconolactone decarboxylase family protein [Aestuariicella hydrocarbonica]NHO65421.1 4-carboxymuconolactone decarboxylase [Aestuariicella hydrocarbonica]
MSIEDQKAGEAIRREVMSDEFVDRALNNANDFDQPLQDLVMENAWGGPWTRDDLPRDTRSLITIAMLIALKAPNELKGHIRGALRNGCSKEEIRAVILHATAYCGFPSAIDAMRAAREIIDNWDESA